MIYEPREDSYLLEKCVKKLATGSVLDMGTGSGIQALAARPKARSVLASDINPEAVMRVQQLGITSVISHLFENIQGTFDTIIFNQPYLPKDPDEDPESALNTAGGKHGHELLERFLRDAKKHLARDGKILLVISSLTKDACSLFKKHRYAYKILEQEKLPFETLSVCVLHGKV